MDQTVLKYPGVPEASGNLTHPRKSFPQTSNFASLPDDALFAVFRRCDVQTLGRLCRVCHRLNTLIQSDSVWLAHQERVMVIHDSAYNSRTKERLILKEQLRVSNNWVEKKYQEKVFLRIHPRQLPWMQYTRDTLWISTNNEVRCFNLKSGGRLREDRQRRLVLQHRGHRRQLIEDSQPGPNLMNEDVSRFVVKDNLAVCGCRDGSLYIFDCARSSCLDVMYKIHRTDTQAVDFHDCCIVTGSRDKTVKIISMTDEDVNNNPVRASVELDDRVWSLATAPEGKQFTVGTSGCKGNPSLSLWDIERMELVCLLGSYRHGAGVLDMKYEDNSTLLTCGYDANLRMWDLRCRQCVKEWHEPYDTTLYCLQSDRNQTVVTGSARYGMIRLWDKRKLDPVQEYFLSQKSPVYSVAFDTSHLYAALDLSIHAIDFSELPT